MRLARRFAALAFLVCPALAAASSPEEAVRAALADCQALPADRQQAARYLSLYHLDREGRARWEKVLRFHVNSLSTEADLANPAPVAPGLWRVYLDDYGWRRETWEKLLDAPEPYFHVRAVLEAAQYQEFGNYYLNGHAVAKGAPGAVWKTTERRLVRTARKEQAAAAPWLDPKEIAALILLTQSQVPVVRADWFVWQTGAAQDRKAGYYEWLSGPKDEADFQKLGGVDAKTAARLTLQLRAVVGRSSVTLNNREIEWLAALTGGYFRSHDFARNNDDKNPFRLLDGDAKPDASEQYLRAANGLWWVALFNAQGKAQATAPDNIASDGKAHGTDRRVHVGVSCFRCHEEGLRPVNNWMRTIHAPPFPLESADYATQKRLRALYLRDMTRVLGRQNAEYAEVLKGLNGLTPKENAEAYGEAWVEYELADRGLEATARELGVDPKAWKERLARAARAEQKLDPVLAALYQGLPLRVEHWEEVYPQAQAIARGK